jgi:hypothetical protein
MLDVTNTTVTHLHLGLSELLAVLIPLGAWCAWKSRHDLVKVVTILRRRSLPDGCQKVAGLLPTPSEPLTLPEPQKASRRLP